MSESYTFEDVAEPESYSFDEATKPEEFSFDEVTAAPAQSPLPKVLPASPAMAVGPMGFIPPPSMISPSKDSGPEPEPAPAAGAARGFFEAGGRLSQAFGALSEMMPLLPPGIPMPIPNVTELQRKRMERTPAQLAQDIQQNPLYKAGQVARDFPDEYLPISEAEKKSLWTQIPEQATGMAGYVASGPYAPAVIGMEAFTEHIVNDYNEGKKKGLSDDEAGSQAMKKALAAGGVQAAVFTVLPPALRKAGDKFLIEKFGQDALAQFFVRRAAQTSETAGVMAAASAGENIVSGRPVTEGLGPATAGGALLGLVTPRGGPEVRPVTRAESAKPLPETSTEPPPPAPPVSATPAPVVEGKFPTADEILKSDDAVLQPTKRLFGEKSVAELARSMTEEQLKQAEPFILEYERNKTAMVEDLKKQLSEGTITPEQFIQQQLDAQFIYGKGKIFTDVFSALNRPLPELVKEPTAPIPPPPEPAATPEVVPSETAPVAAKGKIDDWITKLESMKAGPRPGGSPTFPDPEVFKGVGTALRNTAIDVMIGVLKAGKSINEALDAAMAHIRERSKDFDETKLRTALGAYLNPPETTGIAHRVSEARGMAPERGQGIAPAESVEHGRELLQQGLDPQSVLDVFNKTQAVRADDMAVVRAHLERLSKATNDAADTHGVDSPEYKGAWEAEKDWRAKVKPMQTEWHRIGQAQQGETDIDTGTFSGLQRAHQENSGTDFTPGQKKRAQGIAQTNKQAQESAGTAQEKLNQHLTAKGTDMATAERRAFDAANKTVREWAIKIAEAENKTRVARTVQERELAKVQEERVRKGQEAAQQVARDAAVKLADAENKARVDAAAKERADADQLKATQDALDAANKTVRENAVRLAEAENKARSAQAVRDKATAKVQQKAAQKALDAADQRARQAAADHAANERKLQGDPMLRVWTKAKEYLDQGMDNFDDIRKKLATDLGMSINQVTRLLQQDKRTKHLADDLWKKQQQARNLRSQAKRWVQNLSTPGYIKALQGIPRMMFTLKVGLHGTVALGTHAPTVAFQPRFWKTYVQNFGKMYKMVGSRAYYEGQVQELLRKNNYITARRAGLVNDPFIYEEYAMNPVVGGIAKISPPTAKAINAMTGMGNRGYSVLKILRQDMFDQHWNQLPKSMQNPEMAKAIADAVNHATGVVQGRAPPGTNLALFAPRLEASRVMWLAGDPRRAVGTMLNWKKATQAEKYFAMNQLKEKAWVVGTLGSLLALNQGVLAASGSNQKVNVTDPFKPDFLKFKVAGMNVSYSNPMITMARLPLRLFVGIKNEGKFNKMVYEDENVATILFEYVRSQMSPFAGTTTDLAIGRDFMRRPLPRAAFGLLPGKTHIPMRLRAEGIEPYTWTEYATQQAAMIPLQEALKEVWGKDLGMTAEARKHSLDALATIIVMGGTGARVSEDYSLRPGRASF